MGSHRLDLRSTWSDAELGEGDLMKNRETHVAPELRRCFVWPEKPSDDSPPRGIFFEVDEERDDRGDKSDMMRDILFC